MGFLETPYRKVIEGKVDVITDAQYFLRKGRISRRLLRPTHRSMKQGAFISDRIKCREHGDFPVLTPEEIEYMDVAPNQIVGVSASMIPFLENDDANRALMGSNMQRQAVPLIRPSSLSLVPDWKER